MGHPMTAGGRFDDESEIDYSRKWHVMAAVSMGILLATIDGSIVNIALPALVAEFDTTFSLVQWVVLAYLLTWATLSVSVGRIGDMVGKKRIYTVGYGVFILASVLAGLSPNIYVLIGFRTLQAVGAAMVLSLGIGIVTEAFPSTERGRALGVIGAMVSIGIVTGPTVGGLILQDLSWRWIFFVNVPVGAVGTWMAIRYIPNTPPPGGQRFDFAGAALFFVSLLTTLLALSIGQERGFTQPAILLLFGLGATAMVMFVRVERRVSQPMIDLALFSRVDFTIGLSTGFLSFLALRGVVTTSPFLLTDTLGLEPRQVGLVLAASPIALGIAAPISGRAADRFGPHRITVVGLTVLFGAFLLMQTIEVDTTARQFALILAPIGLGMGIFQSPNNSSIMGSVPKVQLGVAGGMLALNRLLGQIMGFALLITFWSSRLVAGSPGQSGPETEISAFRQTNLGGAVVVLIALSISIWALRRERRLHREPGPVAGQPSAR